MRRELLRLMEWLLNMPEEYKMRYRQEIERIKEEHKLPFVDTLEEIAIEKGIEQGIEQGKEMALRGLILENLTERFGPIPLPTVDRVNSLKDQAELRRLNKVSFAVQSMSEFESRLDAR